MVDNTHRFASGATSYDRFRPRYPAPLIDAVARTISVKAAPDREAACVLDVGSGSGIFSRQLRAALAEGIRIVGVEPSADMRRQAGEADGGGMHGVEFVEGRAEALPAADDSVIGVTAATAAHWFDRPAFYGEAKRVLVAGGVLAIVEYVRDVEGSPAARAVVDFLDSWGEPRTSGRPDYMQELSALDGFEGVESVSETVTLLLSVEDFTGLALSSSYARPAIERLGRPGAEAALAKIGEPLRGADGMIPFGYRFQAFVTRRAGSQ
jgi:ubiquinone/menaquinone biosynthesis C-methylase UbiE